MFNVDDDDKNNLKCERHEILNPHGVHTLQFSWQQSSLVFCWV